VQGRQGEGRVLIGGKRVLESSGPSPAEPPRKVLVQQANHPPEDTKYVCRQQSSGKDKLDTPFKVARWGAVGRDIISSAGDIIPDGFRVEHNSFAVHLSSLSPKFSRKLRRRRKTLRSL